MKKKPKILRILNRFNLGGPVYNASYLTKYLEEDFETLLIGGVKQEDEEDALFIPESLGLKVQIIPEMTRSVGLINEIKAYKRIKKIIAEFQPDIVHTHASKAGALGRLAANNSGVKHIVHTFHGHVFEHYFNSLKTMAIIQFERFLASKSQAIIAISEIQKNDLVKKFNIAPEAKTHIINLGFELNKYQKNNKEFRSAFRKKNNLNEDDIAIGIIGRFAPIKNHTLFIESFASLKKKYPNIKAFIIGDGELKSELQDKCFKEDLSYDTLDSDVFFTSWVKNLEDVIHGLDIVSLTSFNEGTPVSLIEAQASGIPVVSSDVGGVRDVVSESSGLLFESGNKDDFCRQIEKLIESENMRYIMGQNGVEWAFSRFGAERLANDSKKLYLDLLKR